MVKFHTELAVEQVSKNQRQSIQRHSFEGYWSNGIIRSSTHRQKRHCIQTLESEFNKNPKDPKDRG